MNGRHSSKRLCCAHVIKSSLILGSSPELQNDDGDGNNEKAEEDGDSGEADGDGEMVIVRW